MGKMIKIEESLEQLIKRKMLAFSQDIGEWLVMNRKLSYEEKVKEITKALVTLDLSKEEMRNFTAHMLIEVDNARYIMQEEAKFKFILDSGLKNIRSSHMNAAKPRPGKGNAHRTAVKEIMKREKNDGRSFKEFIDMVKSGSIEFIEIIKVFENGQYHILHEAFDKPLEVKWRTLENWYSEIEVKNQS